MTDAQRGILKRMQVLLGVLNDEAKHDLTFAQQLKAHDLFHGSLQHTGLTIAHVLSDNRGNE